MDEAAPVVGVVIVDDQGMFAELLGRILALEEGIEVLGMAGTGAEGLELVERLAPQVVLMDYQLPDMDGVVVTARIKQRSPDVMVVMLTGSAEDRVLAAAIDAGCSGFLTKDRAVPEVGQAVRGAAAGEALISPDLMARLLPTLDRTHEPLGEDLTEREREILALMARGSTNRVIASELYLSVNTVRNYVQSVLTKLHSHSKLEAVATAVRAGIVSYPSEV